jgi:hypothetical protein
MVQTQSGDAGTISIQVVSVAVDVSFTIFVSVAVVVSITIVVSVVVVVSVALVVSIAVVVSVVVVVAITVCIFVIVESRIGCLGQSSWLSWRCSVRTGCLEVKVVGACGQYCQIPARTTTIKANMGRPIAIDHLFPRKSAWSC